MMKNFIFLIGLAGLQAVAETTIDSVNRHAYAANAGWLNLRGNVTNGVVVGQAYCHGSIYAANLGWINLGDGSPSNGYAYNNASASDFGVNHDGRGNLTGYAYGANIGWVHFEQQYGKPRVDLANGVLSGYAYAANAGWISFSNSTAYAKTTVIDTGPDSDLDQIPDSWEYSRTNTLNALTPGDADEDGVSDVDEYGADTDPFDDTDFLAITRMQANGSTTTISWPGKATRLYTLLETETLVPPPAWSNALPSLIPAADGILTGEVIGVPALQKFYQVQAQPPLGL